MKLVVAFLFTACGGDPTVPQPRNVTTSPPLTLPADPALGELAIAPAASRDLESWLPAGSGPFLVEGVLREGKGPPPSWLAVDTAGKETKLTYGTTAQIPYGCDGNTMTVTRLDGDTKLHPGLLWMRPLDSAAWAPKPLAISSTGTPAAARRDYAIGPVSLELVRTQPKLGVASVVWRGRMVHQLKIERHDMDGADNAAPMDFVEGGVGVPVPEAAWSFDRDRAIVIVLRRQSYEGVAFETVVVNADRGRTVETMSLYLYQCAF